MYKVITSVQDTTGAYMNPYVIIHLNVSVTCHICNKPIFPGEYIGLFLNKDCNINDVQMSMDCWCMDCDDKDSTGVGRDAVDQYRKLMHRKQRLEEINRLKK